METQNTSILQQGYFKGTRWLRTSLSFVQTTYLEHRLTKSERMASNRRRKEAEGTPQKQLPTPTTPMTQRYWQIHLTKPKHYCIVWNEQPQAQASMLMHTKRNICAIIKRGASPLQKEPLLNQQTNSLTQEAASNQPKRTSKRGSRKHGQLSIGYRLYGNQT